MSTFQPAATSQAPGLDAAGTHAVDLYLAKVKHLPPAPTVMLRLLELFKQPDRDVDQVVQVISLDPSLTAEILRRCNSAYFGGLEPISEIFEAVSRLGFYEVYCLVVAMFGARTITAAGSARENEIEAIWRHSLFTAVAAGALADQLEEFSGTAFTAALLHDTGKAIFASLEGDAYAQVAQAARAGNRCLHDAERETFGFDHTEIGGRLLSRWEMPAVVSAAVRYHHDLPNAVPHERLTAVIHLANFMSHRLGKDPVVTPGDWDHGPAALEILNLDPDQLYSLAEHAEKQLERLEAIMRV